MPTLDPRVRCDHCGTVLPAPTPAACPSCRKDLREVGTWCEIDKWAKTRQRGILRFIFFHELMAVLTASGAFLLGWLVNGEAPVLHFSILLAFGMIGALLLALWMWRESEKEYLAARKGQDGEP